MTSPLPGQPAWERTQFGITTYYNPYSGRWTTNRAYALRMQRGYQAGIPRQRARGQRPGEAARRRERYIPTPEAPNRSALYALRFEQRYGFSYRYWRRLHRLYLTDLNRRISKGGRIQPYMVADIFALFARGWRDFRRPELTTPEAWIEVHLGERLWATILYQDENDTMYGSYNFTMRTANADIAFWYYH